MKYLLICLALISMTATAGGVDEPGLFPKLDPAPFAGNPFEFTGGLLTVVVKSDSVDK